MYSFVSISLIVLDKNILAILASHGGYVEYIIVAKNYHPRNIPAKFVFKWYGGFREDLNQIQNLQINNKEVYKILLESQLKEKPIAYTKWENV